MVCNTYFKEDKFGWKGLSVESAAHIQSELFTENTSHVRKVR